VRRRRVVVAAVLVVAIFAVPARAAGAASHAGTGASHVGTGASHVGTGACRAYDAIVQRRTRAGARGLVNLSRAEVDDYFNRQARSLAAAADDSSGPLRASLRREMDLTHSVALIVASSWGEKNGDGALAESEDAGYYNVFDYLLRDGVTTLDGKYTSWRRWALLVDDNRQALAVECADLLPNELAQSSVTSGTPAGIPPGTIVFSTGPAIMATSSTGGAVRQVFRLADTMIVVDLAAAPVTGTIAFTAVTTKTDVTHIWLAAPDFTAAHVVSGDPGGGHCPGWSPDGRTIAVSYSRSPREGLYNFFTGDTLTARLRLNDAVGCGRYLTPDQLVVNAGTGNTGDPSLFTTPVTTDDRTLFTTIPGCSIRGPVPSPDRTVVAARATCADPAGDGIYVIPVSTGVPRHILGGYVGDMAWSPDGTWLVYTHVPTGVAAENSELALFVAKADGSEFLQINPGPVTSAMWLPA
jgi:WD40 repeat protein